MGTAPPQLLSPDNYKQVMNKSQNLNDLSSTMRLSPKASSSGGSSGSRARISKAKFVFLFSFIVQ